MAQCVHGRHLRVKEEEDELKERGGGRWRKGERERLANPSIVMTSVLPVKVSAILSAKSFASDLNVQRTILT